ncbi:MAG: c-type cytochrome [Reichenbachiella sp.]
MKLKSYKYIKMVLAAIMLLFASTNTYAQGGSMTLSNSDFTAIVLSLALVVTLIVLVVCIVLLNILKVLVNEQLEDEAKTIGVPVKKGPSWWARLDKKLTDAIPLEEEASIELDHNYDGIKELDNHLPPWWKWLFNLSIVFAVVYMVVYHVANISPLPAEEYEIEVAQAEALKAASASSSEDAIDLSNITFSDDAEILAKGKTIYERNCVACHKAGGEGGIGPNLADEFWIHGGSASEVFNTISDGVVEKGMIAWKDVISPANINAVNSYIYTLRGTNPPNAKSAQGEKYVEAKSE